jgi:mannose-P-dolichol utilization defect protein 1
MNIENTISEKDMADHREQYVFGVVPKQCMESMFVGGSLLHPVGLDALLDARCLKLIASKTIGYTMFAASAAVKVPQILRFVSSRSVSGISAAYVHLELTSTIFSCCYNTLKGNPISTWGEMLNICIQNGVILVLFYHFSGGLGARALVSVSFHAATAYALLTGMLPDLQLPAFACEPLLASMPSACDVLPGQQLMAVVPSLIVLASRAPQIALNFSQGHTGQLSLTTSALFFVGGVARLFTTLTEVNDPILLAGVLVGLLLNGMLVFQLVLFKGATERYAEEQLLRASKSA